MWGEKDGGEAHNCKKKKEVMVLILIDGHLVRPAEGRSRPTDLAISVLSADTNAGHHFY